MIGVVIDRSRLCVHRHQYHQNADELIDSGVYPFLAGIILFGALLFLFPQLALFLPHYFMP